MEKKFAVTIKINQKGPTIEDYHEKLNKLYERFQIIVEDIVYEEDSKGNLHIHGTFTDNRRLYYPAIVKVLKCHFYAIEWKSKGWTDYMLKTKPNKYQQEALVNENYYKHYYGFKGT